MSGTWKRWAFVAGLSTGILCPDGAQAGPADQKVRVRRSKAKGQKRNATGVLQELGFSESRSGELFVDLDLSGPGNFNAYRTHGPERLIVDLMGIQPGALPRRRELSTWVSSGILVYPVQVAGFSATRVEIELRRDVSYELDSEGTRLRVSVSPNKPAPLNASRPASTQAGATQEISKALAAARTQVAAKKAQLAALVRKSELLHREQSASKEQLAAIDRAVRLQKESLVTKQNQAERLQASLAAAKQQLEQTQAQVASMRTRAHQAKAQIASEMAKADRYLAAAKKARQESLELRAQAQAQLDRAKKAAQQKPDAQDDPRLTKALREKNKALKGDRARLARLLEQETRARKSLESGLAKRSQRIKSLESKIERAQTRLANGDTQALRQSLRQAREKQRSLEMAKHALAAEVQRMSRAQKIPTDDHDAEQKKLIKRQRALLLERKAQLQETREQLRATKQERALAAKALAKGRREAKGMAKTQRLAKQKLAQAHRQLEAMHARTDQQTEALRKVQAKLRLAQAKLDRSMKQDLNGESPRVSPRGKRTLVSGLKLVDEGDALRIVLSAKGPLDVKTRQVSPTMQLLELQNARLAPKLERSFDARAYRGPIAKISSFNDDDRVSIMVTASADAPSKVVQRDGMVSWVFPRRAAALAQNGQLQAMESAPVAMAAAQAGAQHGRPSRRRKKWHGERIDIELQDAPIKDVLLLFGDIGRVNIISGKGVSGKVSMKLNAVPWDQALDIILRSLGLGLIKEGNVIRVATQSDLEAERARAIEQASAQVQLKPLETRLVPLSYATVGEMVPKVQSVLSPRGSVTPDTRTNVLIIMDVAENIALAEQLLSQLDGQTPQVLIEARIVEARTQWLRQLGIQWGFDAIASPGTGNPTGLIFPSSVGVAGGSGGGQADRRGLILAGSQQNPNYAVDLPAPVGTGNGGAIGMSFGSLAGNLNTNLRLSAAEEGGEVRLISAPKVVTMDNTEAKIEQGVQIPVSQVSQNGVNTRYVNATLGLQVTPHVTNEGSVILEVQVQKNEADFVNTGARGDPTILTKQANSRMLIQDGDTAVIGGIYTRNQSTNRKKVPWIADVPIVGWFFKNRSEADTRTELLIFLTPKIINRSTSIGG